MTSKPELSGHDRSLFAPSLNQVIKELKREENGLFNCIHSIVSDASFVQQIAQLYSSLPLFANLRCGRWYTPDPDGSCYFKSTDGHFGEWNFSTTRLNLHLALTASQKGGCIVVDATRRGKTFPDALSKTIPIWAAVLNRAIIMHRASWEGAENVATKTWDTAVHLPPWITDTEKAQIEAKLQLWAESLLKAGVDLKDLAKQTVKPLRPLWVSQDSKIWLNEVPVIEELDFIPLVLVSASSPHAGRRQTQSGNAINESLSNASFKYVPGAGDDEESWARGLTPELFWNNEEALLSSGPFDVVSAVKELLHASHEGRFSHDGAHQHPDTTESLQDPGLALGSKAAASNATVWTLVDAILNVGLAKSTLEDGNSGRCAHLPIKSHKYDRHALERSLPAALSFIESHLAQQRRVLVHCDEGVDQSVCVALAVLLSCFTEPSTDGHCFLRKPASLKRMPAGVEQPVNTLRGNTQNSHEELHSGVSIESRPSALVMGNDVPADSGNADLSAGSEALLCEGESKTVLSKAMLRQRLAFISSFYPAACPSRGNLKEVYSFVRTHMSNV